MSMPPKLALVISMYDEVLTVTHTLTRMGPRFTRIEVVQSQEELVPAVAEALGRHEGAAYTLLPNLDPRSADERLAGAERFDAINRSQARNFSVAFSHLLACPDAYEYVVAILGDTLLLHPYGLWAIIQAMREQGAQVGCSRAIGQVFHRADLTREEMADKDHPKGGRLQDESVRDFMPHLFIVHAALTERLAHIEVTNPWCFEQCLGDAIGDAPMHVFAHTAYGYADGVIYNVPSPTNWRH